MSLEAYLLAAPSFSFFGCPSRNKLVRQIRFIEVLHFYVKMISKLLATAMLPGAGGDLTGAEEAAAPGLSGSRVVLWCATTGNHAVSRAERCNASVQEETWTQHASYVFALLLG